MEGTASKYLPCCFASIPTCWLTPNVAASSTAAICFHEPSLTCRMSVLNLGTGRIAQNAAGSKSYLVWSSRDDGIAGVEPVFDTRRNSIGGCLSSSLTVDSSEARSRSNRGQSMRSQVVVASKRSWSRPARMLDGADVVWWSC